ncbi:MAG: putative transport system substrate-binding protein [Bradyrhizobium sp.]|nr:putative transport system substrate-binding protein [Bradyrhizobium sp.]
MRRRQFITLLGGTAAWPLTAQAQPQDGIRRLGVLMANRESDPVGKAFAAALVKGLGALGWREGGNLRIDWRWGAGGDPTLFERYAGELVALGLDALFAQASPSVAALRRETSTIPIVFTMVTDPIGQGFVASLARPGGNITGFSDFDSSMAGKWLGMLTQIAPPVARVAVLYNPATTPYAGLMRRAIEEAAPSFTVAARIAPCRDDAEIETMMTALAHEERGGLLVLTDIFNIVHRDAILASAAHHRQPVVYFDRSFTAAGGLMSYGIDYADLFRRSAAYVDRILNGAKAADLPVQQPTKFELVINLRTAKMLGIEVSPTLLAIADEVFE